MLKTSGSELWTVCSECLCASCWQGKLMCEGSMVAGAVEKTVDELMEMGREHPPYFTGDGP